MNKLIITRIIVFLAGIVAAILFIFIFNEISLKTTIKNRVQYLYSTSPVRVIQDDLIYNYNKDDYSLSLSMINSNKKIIRIDNKIVLVNGLHNDVTKKPLTVREILNSFSTSSVEKIYIDKDIKYNLDDLIENNLQLKKIITKNLTNYSYKDKVYSLPNDLLLNSSYTKEFNLTKKDYDYLYPNVIYSLNKTGDSSDYIFFDDYDNETIEYRYYINDKQFKGWYIDKECTMCYNYETVINKEIITNTQEEMIYNYKPLILYAKWE